MQINTDHKLISTNLQNLFEKTNRFKTTQSSMKGQSHKNLIINRPNLNVSPLKINIITLSEIKALKLTLINKVLTIINKI
jgi:hypothetical protein